MQHALEDRPSFVAPLVLTIAGFSAGAGVLFVGALETIGDCAVVRECDRGIATTYVVAASIAGGIGVLSAIWLTERLIARGAYNLELALIPTSSGVALIGKF